MPNKYLVIINGKPEGPYSPEQLKEMSVPATAFVKTAGMDDYKEAHEVAKLRELLGFAETAVQPQYFAPLDLRLLAAAIDYLIILAGHALITMVLIYFFNDQKSMVVIALAALALAPFTKMVYGAFAEASQKQATAGKALLGLKVCDESGHRLSLPRALARNLAKLLSKLSLGIGYLSGFFDRRQQCLHDKIAGTLVIKDRLL